MVKRIGSFNRKSRTKLTKHIRRRGKISTTRFMQGFENGNKVKLRLEPAVKSGMYHPRFHSKTGVIKGKQGACYEVIIKDGSKQKMLKVHPVHLERI